MLFHQLTILLPLSPLPDWKFCVQRSNNICFVFLVEWSAKGAFVAVAKDNCLSILSSKFNEKLSVALSFKSWVGDSNDDCTVKGGVLLSIKFLLDFYVVFAFWFFVHVSHGLLLFVIICILMIILEVTFSSLSKKLRFPFSFYFIKSELLGQLFVESMLWMYCLMALICMVIAIVFVQVFWSA